ncbi:hypothetical protein NIES4102_25780 [Chondrocystis sp. NIES-4102]|nr:hypothetical protein NIES4102_25780 [Chondrocystis sp. NIES-4102]
MAEADSKVVIDNIILSDKNLLPPIAKDDTATTIQGKTVAIAILDNDAIALNSVQIQTEPQHGTVSYISEDRFAGDDTFTYVVQDSDGQISEPATVDVTVENAIPEITKLQIPNSITEGNITTLVQSPLMPAMTS